MSSTNGCTSRPSAAATSSSDGIHAQLSASHRRHDRVAHLHAGARQGSGAPAHGQAVRRHIESGDVQRLGVFSIQPRLTSSTGSSPSHQRRDDVVAVAAVDDDVLEQQLVLAVVVAGCLQALVRAHFHAVLPGANPVSSLNSCWSARFSRPRLTCQAPSPANCTTSIAPTSSGSQEGNGFLVCCSRYTARSSHGVDMKLIVFVLLAAIVISLGSGLFYLPASARSQRCSGATDSRSAVAILCCSCSYS